DMILDESGESNESKRVKITTACDTCRRRKVKCDGASPCANCQRGGYQCTFSDASNKRPRGPPKGFVALIEDRLHTIESLLVNLVNKDTSDNHNRGIKKEHDQQPSTMTPTSSSSFEDISSPMIGQRQKFSTFKIRHYSPSTTTKASDQSLTLNEDYLDSDDDGLLHQLSPLLLNAIYAIGATFPLPHIDPYNKLIFYDQAKNLLDHFLDVPRLSTIQSLILLFMIDQGNSSTSYRFQTYSSLAVRMAQTIGLNRKNSPIYQLGKNCQSIKLICNQSTKRSKLYLKSLNVCASAANAITHIAVESLNNVYTCITFPTMFYCLIKASKIHLNNISSEKHGLALSAYHNITKTLNICHFYEQNHIMTELATQTIKILENALLMCQDRFTANTNTI
ncbi:8533_t:CDS:2, partial [Entrophospora sp. SA101]